ncbi:MAG: hypothetical protein NPIRA02_17210 [Nitrospirales bacterium]|nr:MAG: hypothetical protein NPIRA02_17210 [Nitrospirales bacterium]
MNEAETKAEHIDAANKATKIFAKAIDMSCRKTFQSAGLKPFDWPTTNLAISRTSELLSPYLCKPRSLR